MSHRAQKPEKETTPGTFFSLTVLSILYLFPISPSYSSLTVSTFTCLTHRHISIPSFSSSSVFSVFFFLFFLQFHCLVWPSQPSIFKDLCLIFFSLWWQDLHWFIYSVAHVYMRKLQVKALQMSPQQRNVKIIQGTLCRQYRRPIWTSFHLAENSFGRKHISKFRIYWPWMTSPALCVSVSRSLPFLWPLLTVYQSQFFHTLFLIFLTSLRGQCEVLALAGSTTRVWLGLVVPEAAGRLALAPEMSEAQSRG